MKHLKTFEILRKDVDHNKIYAYNIHADKNKVCNLIGKIITNRPTSFQNDAMIKGYVEDRPLTKVIIRNDWKKVGEATPEEIELYNSLEASKKYNL